MYILKFKFPINKFNYPIRGNIFVKDEFAGFHEAKFLQIVLKFHHFVIMWRVKINFGCFNFPNDLTSCFAKIYPLKNFHV